MIAHGGVNRLLLAWSGLGLAIGIAAWSIGASAWADRAWILGSLPALAAVFAGIVKGIVRRDAGLDLLALLAIGGAMALGEYATAAVIGFMLATGRSLEDFAEARARREMTALLDRAPRTANRYQPEGLAQIPLDAVEPGDRLLVRGGEAVPTDGTLASGGAVLDESALTGEPLPVRRIAGERVASGSLNAAGPFDMIAATTAQEGTFAGIVRLVAAAQQAKSPAQRLAGRYALLFVPLSLAIAGAAWAAARDPVRALAVLVVATPCPLILAVPVAVVAGMSRCARRGVLVKGGGILEKLAEARLLFFDKTGTLTGGRARLAAIEPAPGFEAGEVLRLAASLDQVSQHPVAQAIVAAARGRGLEPSSSRNSASTSRVAAARGRGLELSMPSEVEETAGAGVRGVVDGHDVVVGNHAFVAAAVPAAAWQSRLMRRIGYEGAAGVFVAIGGTAAGVLLLRDEIRLETPRALRLLRRAGVTKIAMLTGDRRDVAETVGEALGVDAVLAELKPPDKLAAIERSRAAGVTIMVGDGINDAPALAAADVGVAMGARGAAASSEAAGVVLLADRLDRLAEAVLIARRSRAIAVESVVAGMGLSLAAMGVAAFGYLPPLAGAVLQEAIDVAVIVNALRALRSHRLRRPGGVLDAAELRRLKSEHDELAPLLDRVRTAADRIAALPARDIASELHGLNELIARQLLPHERQDDSAVYPAVARLIGGDDPMAAMSRMHREIRHLARLLAQVARDLPRQGPDAQTIAELERILYGLDAILRLHFAQEEEIYHNLADAA